LVYTIAGELSCSEVSSVELIISSHCIHHFDFTPACSRLKDLERAGYRLSRSSSAIQQPIGEVYTSTTTTP
jgi:hypothetical protein